jgi:transcriptional regulator with XRE-family HTH domain
MARTALDWTVSDLAEASGVGRATVARFELGQNVQADRVEAMRLAFEAQGVRFLMNGPHKGGVVPPAPRPIEDESGRNPMLPARGR